MVWHAPSNAGPMVKQSRDLNSRFSSFPHFQQGGKFFLEIVKKRQNSGCFPWGSEGNALRGIHRGHRDLPLCKILSTSGHRCGHKSRLKFYLWRPLAENSRDWMTWFLAQRGRGRPSTRVPICRQNATYVFQQFGFSFRPKITTSQKNFPYIY